MSDKIKKSIESSVKEYNEDEIAMRNGEISLAIERGAKEEKINIAKNLLNLNLDVNSISIATGLSIEEIKNINN